MEQQDLLLWVYFGNGREVFRLIVHHGEDAVAGLSKTGYSGSLDITHPLLPSIGVHKEKITGEVHLVFISKLIEGVQRVCPRRTGGRISKGLKYRTAEGTDIIFIKVSGRTKNNEALLAKRGLSRYLKESGVTVILDLKEVQRPEPS
jgi:hypothetical protein